MSLDTETRGTAAPRLANLAAPERAKLDAPAGPVPSQEGEGGRRIIARKGQQWTAPLDVPSSVPSQEGEGGPGFAAGNGPHDLAPLDMSSVIEDPGETVQSFRGSDAPRIPDRFADPLIMEIREVWRQRQDMVRAQMKLTLQSRAILRRLTGSKDEAERLWKSLNGTQAHPLCPVASVLIGPLQLASQPLEEFRHRHELVLNRLGKRLPIAHLADTIRGINHGTLARMVAEIGDFTAYEKGIAGIWKRAGLAVIDGERQRKKSEADAALRHGYAPHRHAVFWNVSQALLKAQGKDDTAGPYRLIYDARVAYERPRCDRPIIAHNRAMRYMLKRLLRDIWQEWKRITP